MDDTRFFSGFEINFDHVEAPRDFASPELAKPGVGSAFDESLLFPGYGVERANRCPGPTGFDFDEKKQATMAGDDIDFAFAGAAKIFREDVIPVCPQPSDGDLFAEVSDFEVAEARSVSSRQGTG